jgi:glycosyltransferase involved in cell wall biosynthesis
MNTSNWDQDIMRIVIISPFQFSLPRGIERFAYSLGNELGRQGHEVIFYSWASQSPFNWGSWDKGVTHRSVPQFRYYHRKAAAVFYRAWLKKDKPDVVLLNFLYHGEEHLPRQYNYYYVLHSPASQIPDRYSFIQSKLKKFTGMKFIAVSKMVKREARSYIQGHSCDVITNGVDLATFKPADKAPSDKLRIVSAAALEERKGMQHMIRALAEYPGKNKVTYHIYGSGDYKPEIDKLINELNLSEVVELKDSVDNLHEVLPQYDLFCLLSKGEAFPIAPLEAMACGLPLLVSNYEPYPEFVHDDFGRMVDPLNLEHITDALNLFSDSKGVREKMAQSSVAEVQRYSWHNVAEKYVEVFLSF